MKISVCTAAILAAIALVHASSQSNAPVPVGLAGQWNLDSSLTDIPEQIAAAIRLDFGGSGGPEQLFAGPEQGRYGRGRSGGRAQPRGGEPQRPSPEEQDRLASFMAALQYPPTRLTIAQSGNTISFTDAQNQTREFDTSGKRTKQTIGGAAIDVSARYEGPQLVIEQDLGKGRKITSTFSVLPTKQLLVRIALAPSEGQVGPFQIKQVYERAVTQP